MDVRTVQDRAVAKAISGGLAAKVVRRDFGWYEVPSTTRAGVVHTVRHTRGIDGEAALTCTCESGWRPACQHRAAVWLAKREAAGVKVTAVKAEPKRAPRKEVALV